MTETLYWILFIFMAVVLHEVSHGLVAYLLGDSTAKSEGRLSLNPVRHIDIFWTIILPVLLYFTTNGKLVFGMAKPVPVDFSRLRSPRRDTFLVAVAGPAMNLLIAAILSIIYFRTASQFALYGAYLNIGLALFNLIPIPPMDGSRMAACFMPARAAYKFLSIDRWGFIITIALYASGILFKVLAPAFQFVCDLFRIPILNLEF